MSDSNKTTVFVILLLLLVFAIVVWRIWLRHLREMERLDTHVETSREETTRMKLILKAYEKLD